MFEPVAAKVDMFAYIDEVKAMIVLDVAFPAVVVVFWASR